MHSVLRIKKALPIPDHVDTPMPCIAAGSPVTVAGQALLGTLGEYKVDVHPRGQHHGQRQHPEGQHEGVLAAEHQGAGQAEDESRGQTRQDWREEPGQHDWQDALVRGEGFRIRERPVDSLAASVGQRETNNGADCSFK